MKEYRYEYTDTISVILLSFHEMYLERRRSALSLNNEQILTGGDLRYVKR